MLAAGVFVYFHFCQELAPENSATCRCFLQVHEFGHTHSLVSIQQSGPSDQRMLLQTESCLQSQKMSPYKVKGPFSMLICARKQKNGLSGTDQAFFYSQLQQPPCSVIQRVKPTHLLSSHPFCQCRTQLQNGLHQLMICVQILITVVVIKRAS